jgi:glutaredoxin 3
MMAPIISEQNSASTPNSILASKIAQPPAKPIAGPSPVSSATVATLALSLVERDNASAAEMLRASEIAQPRARAVGSVDPIAGPIAERENVSATNSLLANEIAHPPARAVGAMDPIAGRLVALVRQLRLLPEAEADGWTGEPTAWARRNSIPQRLSELSQARLSVVKLCIAERAAGEFDAAAIDAKLDDLITSSGVLMFSFTNCPFCKGAKELLDTKGVRYRVVELDTEVEGAAMRARLGARTGRTSVPSVWIAGECVRGLNDGPGLAPLDGDGLLEPRLRGVGAKP